MSATTEDVINDLNTRNEIAYTILVEAVRELYMIGISESAITLSVRMIYRDITEEMNEVDI